VVLIVLDGLVKTLKDE